MTQEELAQQEAEKIKAQIELDQSYKLKYKVTDKVVCIDDQGQEHVLYLKQPSRMIVGLFLAKIDQNVTEACEYVFYDAVVKEISDVEYFMQDAAFYGIISKLQQLIQVKKSTSMTL